MRALILYALCILSTAASAQPKLLVVFVHQALEHGSIIGGVPSQLAWVVWDRGELEPYRLATGQQVAQNPQSHPVLQIASQADATAARHRLLLQSGASPELVAHTLASRLQRLGMRSVYLYTPQSPRPTAYALLGTRQRRAYFGTSVPQP
jgi:hypothetical protein